MGSIPSDLKKSDRKLKSYKKKSYKIFIFARPSNTKSKKWQKIFDFFFRWHGQKFSITFWKPNFFTKCLVSEYEVPNFETIRINSWYFRQLYNAMLNHLMVHYFLHILLLIRITKKISRSASSHFVLVIRVNNKLLKFSL